MPSHFSKHLKKHIDNLNNQNGYVQLPEIEKTFCPVSLFEALNKKDHCRVNNLMKAAAEGQIIRII